MPQVDHQAIRSPHNKVHWTDEMKQALPKTPAAADLAGVPYYFNANPCKHGHVMPRRAESGTCIECGRIAKRRSGTKTKGGE